MTTFTNIENYLKNASTKPGVYQMLDATGKVLYVGKANNLQKRLKSYFQKNNIAIKTQSLVKQIASIKTDITRSETEALLLESNLIKTLRPKYNVLLRDDKTYPYIRVTLDHPWPRMELYRSKKKPKGDNFFGPFPSAKAVRETLNIIQKVFKIRNCSDQFFSNRSRPCLQYQIGRCSAPCTNYITPADYHQSLEEALRFLKGKCQQVIARFEQRMAVAAEHLAFEEAATLRDQIKALRLIQESQDINFMRGDADILAIHAEVGFACVQYVSVRDGQIVGSRSFFPAMPEITLEHDQKQLVSEVFQAFLSFYYLDHLERLPREIIISQEISNYSAVEKMLNEIAKKPCRIIVNPRGQKARWLEFAQKNLQLSIDEQLNVASALAKRFKCLEDFLNLPAIFRLECFDVSHTQGNFTMASAVVFDAKGPLKSEYRRFNIIGVKKGDDYGALKQALTRRFKNLKRDIPDLLIIDGGKGQVNIAKSVLKELNLQNIYLLGIAKGKDRKPGWEHLILADEKREVILNSDNPALHLLQHIRDEAHRFAITAHQKKRQKSQLLSSLEAIAGIGPRRRHALLSRFGGVQELAKAPLEEIAKVHGISLELAGRIYEHFQQS